MYYYMDVIQWEYLFINKDYPDFEHNNIKSQLTQI